MRKISSLPVLMVLLCMLTAFNCRKHPIDPEFYYRCLVDGQLYIPNACANCNSCEFLGDTAFILGANRGFEALIIGIHGSEAITAKTYVLDNATSRRASYDNTTEVNDIFVTNSENTGELIINSLDKTKNIVEGTFYFRAYNPARDTVVHVTQGKFRLEFLRY
jgi:hypothetical protein